MERYTRTFLSYYCTQNSGMVTAICTSRLRIRLPLKNSINMTQLLQTITKSYLLKLRSVWGHQTHIRLNLNLRKATANRKNADQTDSWIYSGQKENLIFKHRKSHLYNLLYICNKGKKGDCTRFRHFTFNFEFFLSHFICRHNDNSICRTK